jgi:conjugal transfer pilus assembly protein TraK
MMINEHILALCRTLVIALSVFSGTALAESIKPKEIEFSENEQITLSLSQTEINKLTVVGDKITDVFATQGYLEYQNDESGNLYTYVRNAEPFTAFISTQKGHTFSIQVKPQVKPSVTAVFMPKESLQVSSSSDLVNGEYVGTLVALSKAMIQGKTIDGYGVHTLNEPLTLEARSMRKEFKAFLVSEYRGEKMKGQIILIKNISKDTMKLTEDLFKISGTRAITLSDELMPPNHETLVYVITDQGRGI